MPIPGLSVKAILFARVIAEKRRFNMRTNSETPGRFTIRLLNDVEQRTAQAGMN